MSNTLSVVKSDPTFSVSADAMSSQKRSYTLKSDDTFAVFGPGGDMNDHADGLFHQDTRYLSKLFLSIGQTQLRLLSSAVSADNTLLVCDWACPAPRPNLDMGDDGNEISIRRETILWKSTRQDRLTVSSWSALPQTIWIKISFGSDFADLFEVRGTKRARHGIVQVPVYTDNSVVLACLGIDNRLRSTELRFEPKPTTLDGENAIFRLDLVAGKTHEITISTLCSAAENSATGVTSIPLSGSKEFISSDFISSLRSVRAHGRFLRRNTGEVSTGSSLVDAVLRRARDDLFMLTTATESGPFPYAGVPWFSTAFGRDALITALEVLWLAPGLARGVLSYLAANQADKIDPRADAEPGKILHESRDGDMARCGEVPFRRYYGSVDSTPLFIILAGAYFDRTGDVGFARILWPHILAALEWIDIYGDADGDGFVEYGNKAKDGLVNQGWKDSRDSIFHSDGTLAQGPIAVCEVQGYVFAAKQAAARIATALDMREKALELAAQSASLMTAFNNAFWDEDLGFYVLALDGLKRPCRVLSSNAGHALFAGIALPEQAMRVADTLMSPEFFSGWGIRTIATGQARFNPMSYHNGSVWPHDNALIGLGLARYGRPDDTARLFESLLAAAAREDRYRLPELFNGLARGIAGAVTAYPVACAPQAWAAGALPALLGACAGLEFNIPGGVVHAPRPTLPFGVDNLQIRNLEVGSRLTQISLTR